MCGSTGAENQIQSEQLSAFNTMNAEAGQVFGENSALYSQLLAAFEPILNAGPNQEGFSAPELSALNSEATSAVAANYEKASTAVRDAAAGAGGGNTYVPSGEEAQAAGEVANAAAAKESSEQQQITEADYAAGRQKYQGAVEGLLSAGNVFTPSEEFNRESVSAGSSASQTAHWIAQDKYAPIGGLLGAAAGLGGMAIRRMGSGGSGGGGSSYGGGSGYGATYNYGGAGGSKYAYGGT